VNYQPSLKAEWCTHTVQPRGWADEAPTQHCTAGTSCAASSIACSGTPGNVRQYDSGCGRTFAHARATTSRAQITAVSKLEAAKAACDLAKDDEEVL
jgi:hypothetical protein